MWFPKRILVQTLYTRKGAQVRRYAEDLAARLRLPVEPLEAAGGSGTDVLRVALSAPRPSAVPTIVPTEEEKVARAPGPVMVPLSNGPSGIEALDAASSIVAALGLPVLFYHTTWKDPRVVSNDPRAHMCDAARETMAKAEALAVSRGLASVSIVEMAESVVDGALLCALSNRCALILTARSPAIGKGSYVDHLLARSPIPVLVTA